MSVRPEKHYFDYIPVNLNLMWQYILILVTTKFIEPLFCCKYLCYYALPPFEYLYLFLSRISIFILDVHFY